MRVVNQKFVALFTGLTADGGFGEQSSPESIMFPLKDYEIISIES